MRSENKHSNISLIVTIAMAAVATVAVVILLVNMNKNGSPENESSSIIVNSFVVTAELYSECESAATELVSANYEVIRLFVTEGLPLKKVYGKVSEPIDGAYVTVSDKYTEYSQIETLVKGIYTYEAANKLLTEFEVSPSKKIQVYKDYSIPGDTFLGMNAEFSVNKDYDTDWSTCFVMVKPQSEDKCLVTVYVNGVFKDDAAAHPESVLETTMTKTADGWRLAELLK